MNETEIREWLFYNLPLTYAKQKNWLLNKVVKDDVVSLLDIGCGIGKLEVFNKHESVGVEIFKDSLNKAERNGNYKELVNCDARYISFSDKSFDGVTCIDVIEHLNRYDGLVLLDRMEKIARKLIVIVTPFGEDLAVRHNPNPYQQHQSGWYPDEFIERGYKIIPLYTLSCRVLGDLWWQTIIHYGLDIITMPLVGLFPYQLADEFMAVKELK